VSRQPPAVGLSCRGGGAWRVGQVLLAVLATAVFVAWALLHAGLAGGAAAGSAALTAAVAAAIVTRASRPRPLTLQWDGESWRIDGAPGEVDVMIDLGRWLLLRFRPPAGAALWLPVPAAEAGPAWHALRAALYARAPRLPKGQST
jgi:hypothetical protein